MKDVCTFVDLEHKIVDILILKSAVGWTLYRDNPDLLDSEYSYKPFPETVIRNLGNRIIAPLILKRYV